MVCEDNVSEASHPGPPRLRMLCWAMRCPPRAMCQVRGRVIHDLPSTVAASPRALGAVAMNDSSEDDAENGSVGSTMTVITDEEDREPRSDVDVPLEDHVTVGSVDVPVPTVDMQAQQMPRRVFTEALRLLDEVDLALIFRRRAVVMKSVPKFM